MTTMHGKTCLVTGATQGIGRETAMGLAAAGATLVIVGRDAARTAETVAALKAASKNDSITSLLGDLSRPADVRRIAAEFKSSHGTLDVLINNAGGMFSARELTADGFERTWALNHLNYFLLTHELLDVLKATHRARIVNVASTVHMNGKIEFDNLQGERKYGAMPAYSASKLANVMFTYALAKRLEGTGVTVNCLHPGIVATGFGQNTGGFWRVLLTLMRPFMTKARDGAKTSLYLATSPDVAGVSGQYFDGGKVAASSALSHDAGMQEKLWTATQRQLGL
ncbi:MAG: SDR family oxidoreductase [Micavibrio sp.]|nr:SDR family oxidoreductase [Micavibrio sp.]